MEHHFVLPKERKTRSKSSILKFLWTLLPVLVISAILPLFVFFFSAPPELTFQTQASEKQDVRIWFEPSQVVTTVGTQIELNVYAATQTDGDLVSSLEILLENENATFNTNMLKRDIPFRGQVLLGKVKVVPTISGEIKLEINPSDVVVGNLRRPLDVITSGATLRVK